MKKLLLLLLFLVAGFSLSAQNIKSRSIDAKDIISLLRNDGYDLYSFDLNDFMKGDYNVTLYIKEYSKEAGEINLRGFDVGGNKILFSQFTEEEKKAAKELGLTKGMKRGIFYKIDRINLALIPNKAESLMKLNAEYGNLGAVSQRLKLRPISAENVYKYEIRPFVIDNFESGKFIPLVAILSYWYDEKAKLIRCCGEPMLKSDLSDEILENVPHYYIIGVTLDKIEKKEN